MALRLNKETLQILACRAAEQQDILAGIAANKQRPEKRASIISACLGYTFTMIDCH